VAELPCLVDRADPSRFAILWSEVEAVSWKDAQRQQALTEADRLNAAPQGPLTAGSGPAGFMQAGPSQPGPAQAGAVQWTELRGGQVQGASLSPEVAAAVQAAFGQVMHGAGAIPGQQDEEVLATPGRPAPGTPGGGLTPDQAAALLTRGQAERANAVVVDAREIAVAPGMPSAPGGTVDITLDIAAADGSRYTTVTRVGFSTPQRRARIATVGTQLTVRVDPADRSRVAIDTSGLF
jgi:hypothetical protein